MIEFKFKKIQDMVLYNIARARKKCGIGDIKKLTGDSLDEKQIYNAIDNLKRRKLIKKDKEKNYYGLNMNQIQRIKKVLGEHWENNWEGDWNAVSP